MTSPATVPMATPITGSLRGTTTTLNGHGSFETQAWYAVEGQHLPATNEVPPPRKKALRGPTLSDRYRASETHSRIAVGSTSNRPAPPHSVERSNDGADGNEVTNA